MHFPEGESVKTQPVTMAFNSKYLLSNVNFEMLQRKYCFYYVNGDLAIFKEDIKMQLS